MLKKILLAFIICPTFSLMGQSTNLGYLGKKKIFIYEGAVVGNYNVLFRVDSEEAFEFSPMVNRIGYERVLSKRYGIRFTAAYRTTLFKPDNTALIRGGNSIFVASSNWRTNEFGFGINLRTYSRNHIAPLGLYQNFSVEAFIYNANTDDIQYTNTQSGETLNLSNVDNRGNFFTVGYGFGFSRVIADKYMLTYGANLSLLISEGVSGGNDTIIKEIIVNRIKSTEAMLSINIGFGILK